MAMPQQHRRGDPPGGRRVRCVPLFVTLVLAGCHGIALRSAVPEPAASTVRHAAAEHPVIRATLGPPVGGIVQGDDQVVVTLGVAVGGPGIPPPTREEPIDLCAALERAGVDNPTIALADEAIRASAALRLQARALLLPTLNAGTNVRIHQGELLSAGGIVRDVNIQSLYLGAGAGARAAETVPIPGVRIYSHLADACYEPQAAEQQVIARRFDALAVRNRTLLEVGTAYLVLAAAQGELAALGRSAEDLDKIVRLTADFASTGQGRDSDAQRARANRMLLDTQVQQTQETIAVAAADLARLLDLDPSVRLVSADSLPPLVELVNPDAPLAELVQIALANHPELTARGADVASAQVHVRQERVRPWLPLVAAGFSAGDFGGTGTQASPSSWTSGLRMDVDVAAVWSLQNLLVGNRAIVNRARAAAGQAEADRLAVANRIRTEVAEAFTQISARRREIDLVRRRAASAQQAFEEDLLRSRNLEGRPIAVLRSYELLVAARVDLVRALAGYSQAQLQLFVALGNTPRCPGY
jgi:outer membrane protein TolC